MAGLPNFDSIEANHIEPAIDHLISNNLSRVKSILEDITDLNWDNFVQVMEDMDDQLNRAWSPASHLHSVADNDELRKVYKACLP
ncbi:MAG: oligopeptidase A, partial [Proteobacteria bacterium]|nr:oligopeptidase A [Pseudomonadota bacterium]